MGIEFHMVNVGGAERDTMLFRYIKQYFTIIQHLYKLGFVSIMWEENRGQSYLYRGSQIFEIVFRRSNLAACFE